MKPRLWFACAIGMLVMSALPIRAQPETPLRVGFIGPLSGGSSDFGNSARWGAELAIKEINEVGGFLGRPFELVVRDDKGDPDEGRRASQDLVLRQHVDFTVGFCNTGVAMKSLDVFQNNKHLLMVPCSQGTAVTSRYPAHESFIFRVAPPDHMNARFLVSEIVERRKIRQVAILADKTGYGDGGMKDVTAELARHGLQPVKVLRFDLGVKSLRSEMLAAKEAGAQALVVYAVGPEQATAARSRAEIGWQVPYFAPWPLSFRSVIEQAGAQVLEGTMMAQTIIQDTANERRASFLARYSRHAKEPRIGSLMAAAQAYDAVHLVLWAMFTTRGDTSGPALKQALETLDRRYAGVVTTYDHPFSKTDHDAFSVNMIWLGTWRGGEIRFFHDEDAKRSSYIRRKSDSPDHPGVAPMPVAGAFTR